MPMTPYPGTAPEEDPVVTLDLAEARAQWRRAMRVAMEVAQRNKENEKEKDYGVHPQTT